MALTRPNAAQVNFDVTNITDPLIGLNSSQSGTNDKDIGIVFERGSDTNVAIIWDESSNQFSVVNTTETGSTSGDVNISSYADIKANAYYGDGSNLTGITSYTDSDVSAYLSNNGYGTSSSIIASITDSAPGTLDTLNELAAALGDDANFSTTVTNSIATKLSLSGGTMTGSLNMGDNNVNDIGKLNFNNHEGSSYGVTGDVMFDENFYSDTEYGTAWSGGNGGGLAVYNEDGWGRILTDRNIQWHTATFDGLKVGSNTVWHAGNDGSGSGLDADTLDGIQASSFLRSDTNDTTSGTLTVQTLTVNSNTYTTTSDIALTANSVINAENSMNFGLTDGSSGYYSWRFGNTSKTGGTAGSTEKMKLTAAGALTVNGATAWTSGNDGSGSGLDADLLDGDQKSDVIKQLGRNSLTNVDDLNTLSGHGWYSWSSNNPSNSPADYGVLRYLNDGSQDQQWVTAYGGAANKVELYGRRKTSGSWDTTWTRFWSNANDGAGSGLDADKLDGMQPASANTASTVVSRDASGNFSAGTITATATAAQYADLAENYLADAEYPIGTVLEIGGDAEVTIANPDSYKIVGTVSEAPGLLMNSELKGENVVPVAYIGRVPCRVQGTIERGDFLVVGNTPGVAVAKHPRDILAGQAIGKALESHTGNEQGVIEILVGRL